MATVKPILLIILDGYGYTPEHTYNAIYNAKKPNINKWFSEYPHTYLKASGEAVGLLPGTIGTSEVGHLTIGCGRVIPESVLRIHQMIADGSFFKNPLLQKDLEKIKASNGTLHIMGLLSDAGVHSHISHAFAFIKAAVDAGITKLIIHPFLDGRDTPPRSSLTYLDELQKVLDSYKIGTIGTIHGRFYAMDRDKNWQRTEQSFDTLTKPQAHIFPDWHAKIKEYYQQGIYDEFIPPFQVEKNCTIKDSDGLIFFNFRADRARQITRCFLYPDTVPFHPQKINLSFFLGSTNYDTEYPNEHILDKQPIQHTLKEIVSDAHKKIFSIAETEKYAHVTYFFSGGRETPYPGETWKLIPSIKTKDYVHYPCMSAPEITQAILQSLEHDPADLYVINYANADMVGHSGNYEATVKAIECLDKQLKQLYDVAITKMNGIMFIMGDHGNAEHMYDEKDHQPKTSHTLNPVPFIMIEKGLEHSQVTLPVHELADIAPFILQIMGLLIPPEMKHHQEKSVTSFKS